LYRNDALLLIGHGSVRYPDAAGTMHQHAEALRQAALFAQVEVALLHGAPSVDEALDRITVPTLRVVPFFMEDGYFSGVTVPRALAGRAAMICPPVGVHDGIAGLIEHHALAACDGLDVASRRAAILVIGHGSASAPGRALALHRHASRIAATELFARVETACLEEAPFLADALTALRAHLVVLIGFFANHGAHVRDDVPALIAAELTARGSVAPTVRFGGCVTDDPAMVQIIIDQAAAA
jgi:sirohydrochlorin cobaltochelatase